MFCTIVIGWKDLNFLFHTIAISFGHFKKSVFDCCLYFEDADVVSLCWSPPLNQNNHRKCNFLIISKMICTKTWVGPSKTTASPFVTPSCLWEDHRMLTGWWIVGHLSLLLWFTSGTLKEIPGLGKTSVIKRRSLTPPTTNLVDTVGLQESEQNP